MVQILDTTLRDGANIVGHGFNREMTLSIIRGLITAGITQIEYGNCKGLGAYNKLHAKIALTDEEYLALLSQFAGKAHLGMFMMANCTDMQNIAFAASSGLSFLRVGANAGDGANSLEAVKAVKESGMVCRYSLMKAYAISPEKLADEAKMLQDAGVDAITVMDSAGTMLPDEVKHYIGAVKKVVTIPVGFHGHSNLGLSSANAIAAVEAGADEIDSGLLGMARSAGNCATEVAIATFMRTGMLRGIDLIALLKYLDNELIPKMEEFRYYPAIRPIDLILGYAGCHSSFLPAFQKIAKEEQVDLYGLIIETSKIDQKAPSEILIRQIVKQMKLGFKS